MDTSFDHDFMSNNEDEQNEKRINYFEVLRESLSKQGNAGFLYRVVIVGELSKDVDKIELGGYYQKLFKQFQNDSELITGILLFLKSTCFVHTIEASRKVMMGFFRDLNKPRHPETKNPLNYMSNIRILIVSDDVTSRLYPFWASRAIESKEDLSKETDDSVFAEDAIDKTISDICVKMMNLGSKLSSLSKGELKQAIDEMGERFKDFIPSASLILATSHCQDILSLSEWLEFFDSQASIVFENELVWPISKPIIIT